MLKRKFCLILGLFVAFLLFKNVQAQSISADTTSVAHSGVDAYELSPAYPNPFNPRTSFSLTVHERQEVSIDVFNLLGTQVRHLFTGVLEAGEPKIFTIEAGDLPTGIYLYRIGGSTFSATRQVTLLK